MTFINEQNFQRGELVKTAEGYFGIVLEQKGPIIVEVFLGNGLTALEAGYNLEQVPLPGSTAPHCFHEVMKEWPTK